MTMTQEITPVGQRVAWNEMAVAGEDVRHGDEGIVTEARFRRGEPAWLTVEFDNGEQLDVQPTDVTIIG